MRIIPAGIALCLLIPLICIGCGKSEGPPIPVQYVQVQASYLSEGYDVYQYVAIKKQMDAAPDRLNMLLDYFENLYKSEGKVKVMIFPDAASAITAVSGRVLATLEMENGKVTMRVVNTT